jgi:mRNA-degrading endonuclease toxin of MazEF toxin-antitoxin module
MVTSPAVSPALSVLIVCAWTGSTAAAKPLPTAVRTKSRRLKARVGVKLSRSLRSIVELQVTDGAF